ADLRAGSHDAFFLCRAGETWRAARQHLRFDGAQHEVCNWLLRTLPIRTAFHLQGWPGICAVTSRAFIQDTGDMTMTKPKLAVWKFASCEGCPLSLLDCEDELLAVAGAIDIANFAEANRDIQPGPYDLSLVEGSITTAHDAERIQEVRRLSKYLVTIGA